MEYCTAVSFPCMLYFTGSLLTYGYILDLVDPYDMEMYHSAVHKIGGNEAIPVFYFTVGTLPDCIQ